MKLNTGISLISVVITVVVIIILSAIVIFNGLNTPDNANFASFTSEFSDFSLAVTNDSIKLKADLALNGRPIRDSQIYYMIAKGIDSPINYEPSGDGKVTDLGTIYPRGLTGENYYKITSDKNVDGWDREVKYWTEAEEHYITDTGVTFVLPGYLVKSNGEEQWWINEKMYYIDEKK